MVIEIDPEYESGSAGSPRSRPEERTAAAQTQQGMYPATVLSPEDAGPLTEASRTARRDDAGSTQRTGLLPKVAAALGLGPEPELDGRFKDLKVKRRRQLPVTVRAGPKTLMVASRRLSRRIPPVCRVS